jgi:hypothetical protein
VTDHTTGPHHEKEAIMKTPNPVPSRPRVTALLAGALSALLLSACGGAADAGATAADDDAPGLEPAERYIHVQATELDARREPRRSPW